MVWYVVFVTALAQFIAAYTGNVTVIALPQIAKVFGLSNILQNWVVNIFTLTIAILSVPFGKICSKYGLKRSFLLGEIVFFIGAIGTILSINAPMLFAFRIIQGVGSTAIFVSSIAMMVRAVPDNERGRAIGISTGSVYLGLSFLIPSTIGCATLTMPIMSQLTASLGYNPAVMVMIFSAASGVINLFTPTSGVVMGGLSIAKVEYSTWLKWASKLIIILAIVSCIILTIAMIVL